mmetsp:Transcript_13702/g.25506  ORF Transcript_13702/g.25506 Transcript_13702/m.25506 type:complete len:100 (+) Transcript_13702:358-657(+)
MLLVSVSTSIISRELTRLFASHKDFVNETCLTSCRLVTPTSDDREECELQAVRFYPMSERRVLSVENVQDARRVHAEHIMLSLPDFGSYKACELSTRQL